MSGLLHHAQPPRPVGQPVGDGVEAGAQEEVLRRTARGGVPQAVLRVPAAQHHVLLLLAS